MRRSALLVLGAGAAASVAWALGASDGARPRHGDLADPDGGAATEAAPCRACHAAPVDAWAGSQHARACRGPRPDDARPPAAPGAVRGWIGVAPLEQALVEVAGQLQVFDPARDVATGAWFSIAGASPPPPDAWGHWTQRGMRWASQCAGCHMTGLDPGWDLATERHHPSWDAAGIACSRCHGDAGDHTTTAAAPTTRAARPSSDVCLPCHARREALTAEVGPGAAFDASYRLLLPDEPGLYFPDGRADDELFEAGPLALSRMGQRGVGCLDCHDPHSGALRRPVSDDALCLGCHAAPGARGATVIDPPRHHHHPRASAGARCVACHMPERVYMARDPRRDHAFALPDPALAHELALPDVCGDCHRDWDAARTEATFARLFPRSPALARQARRARAVRAAERGDPSVVTELVNLAESEEVDAWRAALVGLLRGLAAEPSAEAALARALEAPSPRVRAAAVRAATRAPSLRPRLVARRDDPALVVRLAAMLALRGATTAPASTTAATPFDALGTWARQTELACWLAASSDQPAGALRASELALHADRGDDALRWAERAVRWDPSGPSYHQLARALAAVGRSDEAARALTRARRLLGDVGPARPGEPAPAAP